VALHHTPAGLPAVEPGAVDWRHGLPVLRHGGDCMRELRADDAPSLVAHLHSPRVIRYIAPCPTTAKAFRRFIRWTHVERSRGALACYGIVPEGAAHAVGIIQVWRIERDFSTAEMGFALGEAFWGGGLFVRAARPVLDVAFSQIGVHRLEARAVDVNGRGNGILAKLGATREGVLRDGFRDGDTYRDHVMWSILAPDWRLSRQHRAHGD
jgi:[ribosomal protein S5]-alanine N-acetyltransferase